MEIFTESDESERKTQGVNIGKPKAGYICLQFYESGSIGSHDKKATTNNEDDKSKTNFKMIYFFL